MGDIYRLRRGEHPQAHLATWSGILQADAYGGYGELYAPGRTPGPVLEAGFNVLPRRWVVKRIFGWMTRWRRLVRDYEQRLDVSEAMIHVALGSLLLRRIAHP